MFFLLFNAAQMPSEFEKLNMETAQASLQTHAELFEAIESPYIPLPSLLGNIKGLFASNSLDSIQRAIIMQIAVDRMNDPSSAIDEVVNFVEQLLSENLTVADKKALQAIIPTLTDDPSVNLETLCSIADRLALLPSDFYVPMDHIDASQMRETIHNLETTFEALLSVFISSNDQDIRQEIVDILIGRVNIGEIDLSQTTWVFRDPSVDIRYLLHILNNVIAEDDIHTMHHVLIERMKESLDELMAVKRSVDPEDPIIRAADNILRRKSEDR